MKNTVHVKGCILRDAENERKRNYVNLMLTLKADGEEIYYYHLINYAANGNSVRHLFKVVNSDDKRKIEKGYEEKHISKLARNRVVYREIDEEFDLEDHGKFVDELSGAEMKVLISAAKSLAGGMKARAKLITDIRTRREEDEEEEKSHVGLSSPVKRVPLPRWCLTTSCWPRRPRPLSGRPRLPPTRTEACFNAHADQ